MGPRSAERGGGRGRGKVTELFRTVSTPDGAGAEAARAEQRGENANQERGPLSRKRQEHRGGKAHISAPVHRGTLMSTVLAAPLP